MNQNIYPASYISLGTVLARELVIGSAPIKTLYTVRLGKGKDFSTNSLSLKYFGSSKEKFFGYQVEHGIKYASAEKAFVDLLYYHSRGFKPSFNIYSDLNLKRINKESVVNILEKYKNKNFAAFVSGIMNGN